MKTPPKIDLLPEHLIDQIKAGEVIERPGSLIKEILENAVDAGSTKLELTIKNNGLDLISLKDNGHGMRFEDLPLAFSRHATSKITRFEDIYRLGSFGFRGEALASIAAVARVQCLSFIAGESEGAELRIEGGETILHTKRKNDGNRGTELVIQDLFFNTPARLKFIQSQQAEKKYIRTLVYSFVLSHPEIEFGLRFEDEERDHYPIVGSLEERVLSVFPRARERVLTEVRQYENYQLRVILLPASFRGPVPVRYVFVNDRYVLDKQLHRVLTQSLLSHLGSDEYHYLAFFSLPADSVDVNVHPNKTIVKFLENSKLVSLLSSTVKEFARSSPAASDQSFSSGVAPAFSFPEGEGAIELLQERHEYNMDGVFSPHNLAQDNTETFWIGPYLIRKETLGWIAVDTGKLLESYVTARLEVAAPTLPLLVSEPFPLKDAEAARVRELNSRGFEFEKLGPETLVLRAIPEWLNGFPLRDLVHALLKKDPVSGIVLNPRDWSESAWDEMLGALGGVELRRSGIVCDLEDVLREKFR